MSKRQELSSALIPMIIKYDVLIYNAAVKHEKLKINKIPFNVNESIIEAMSQIRINPNHKVSFYEDATSTIEDGSVIGKIKINSKNLTNASIAEAIKNNNFDDFVFTQYWGWGKTRIPVLCEVHELFASLVENSYVLSFKIRYYEWENKSVKKFRFFGGSDDA